MEKDSTTPSILRRNLNDGQPWSDLDIRDLQHSLESGETIERTANFLCRNVLEVLAKADELGLVQKGEPSTVVVTARHADGTSWSAGEDE